MITVEGILKKKKKSKVHVTIVPSVIAVLTDGVPELKNFKTFGESIEKIETLEVKLKIAANFEEIKK